VIKKIINHYVLDVLFVFIDEDYSDVRACV